LSSQIFLPLLSRYTYTTCAHNFRTFHSLKFSTKHRQIQTTHTHPMFQRKGNLLYFHRLFALYPSLRCQLRCPCLRKLALLTFLSH
jgi:hypothetical protein